jgi:hypothetical protein
LPNSPVTLTLGGQYYVSVSGAGFDLADIFTRGGVIHRIHSVIIPRNLPSEGSVVEPTGYPAELIAAETTPAATSRATPAASVTPETPRNPANPANAEKSPEVSSPPKSSAASIVAQLSSLVGALGALIVA